MPPPSFASSGTRLSEIDPLGKTQRNILHNPRQGDVTHLNDQMDMVPHQAKSMNTAMKHLNGVLKDYIKAISVTVIEEDWISGVTAKNNVVISTGIMNAGFASHRLRLAVNVRKSRPHLYRHQYLRVAGSG